MNVAVRRPMTVAEFLRWEDRQPTKYEFDGFRPVAMVGVTNAHSIIQSNLIAALIMRLRGTTCRPHGSDLKVSVAGRIRYPDALVVCTPVAGDAKLIAEPVVVFEILSATSEHTDLVLKMEEYRATPSIQHYVVLQQAQAGALVFNRRGEDWNPEGLHGPDAVLRLTALSVELTLSELYEDVPFATEEEGGDAER